MTLLSLINVRGWLPAICRCVFLVATLSSATVSFGQVPGAGGLSSSMGTVPNEWQFGLQLFHLLLAQKGLQSTLDIDRGIRFSNDRSCF